MKTRKIFSNALLSVSIVIAGFLLSNALTKAKLLDRTVTVKGLSERIVESDLAVWPIQIALVGNNLSTINKTLEKQKKDLLDYLKEAGLKNGEIVVGVVNIVDEKQNNYGNRVIENRYSAKADFVIRTSNVTKIREVLEKVLKLTEKGVLVQSKNQWQPIQYSFTKLNAIKPEMVREATINAKKVAQEFASDSGSNLGKIKTARQGIFSILNRDPATPQTKKVRVVSTIEYYLKN